MGKRKRSIGIGSAVLLSVIFWAALLNRPGNRDGSAENAGAGKCYPVRTVIWEMGTEGEVREHVLYDPKEKCFLMQSGDGERTVSAKDRKRSTKPVMEFSFDSKGLKNGDATAELFETSDIGTGDIYRGTKKDVYEGYGSLLAQGYRNRYTVIDADSVDMYLQRGDDCFRLLVVPEVSGANCIVTFAQIDAAVLEGKVS